MRQLFRPEALEHVSSPDYLDEMIRIVTPKHGLALATFGALILLGLVWGMVGRLPTTVSGRGMLIRPFKVIDFQAPASGRLTMFALRAGDTVRAGDVLGVIDQAELRQQLQDERAKLQQLLAQDQAKTKLQVQNKTLQDQQSELEVQKVRLQRFNVQKRLRDAQAKAPLLKTRLDNHKRLETLGLSPKLSDERLQAEQAYLENQDHMAALQAELKHLESALKQIESRARQSTLDNLEMTTSRQNMIQAVQHQISQLTVQLTTHSQIVSLHDGRVLETTVQSGQWVEMGKRLGSIEMVDATAQLVGMTYFPIQTGKQIRPGMTIQVAPDTVERQRFGSLLGTVTSVSMFPVTRDGVASRVGNSEVADLLVARQPAIEVSATLTPNPATASGYQWTSSYGPAHRLTPGTTMIGRVVIEQRAPITYLLPILRDISGLY